MDLEVLLDIQSSLCVTPKHWMSFSQPLVFTLKVLLICGVRQAHYIFYMVIIKQPSPHFIPFVTVERNLSLSVEMHTEVLIDKIS